MARIETLGVLISSDTRLTPDKLPEDRILADLLNLHGLSHRVVQDGGLPFTFICNCQLRPVLKYLITVSWDVRTQVHNAIGRAMLSPCG